jgi:pyrophosphatase PpaX
MPHLPSSPPPPLPVLLFDLDGTLLDTIELLLSSMHHAFEGREHRPSDGDWIAGIGTPLNAQLLEFARSPDDLTLLLERYRAFQREHHDRLTRSYPGAAATLESLRARGHRFAVVTSKIEELAHRGLTHVGMTHLFETVVGLDSTTRHKPHPEPVLVALDRLGAQPHQAAFIGDSPHDVHSGNAAGVTTIAALWGPFSRTDLIPAAPTFFLERITDLPALLDRAAGTGHIHREGLRP